MESVSDTGRVWKLLPAKLECGSSTATDFLCVVDIVLNQG